MGHLAPFGAALQERVRMYGFVRTPKAYGTLVSSRSMSLKSASDRGISSPLR